jgi:hypothetical protein
MADRVLVAFRGAWGFAGGMDSGATIPVREGPRERDSRPFIDGRRASAPPATAVMTNTFIP